MNFDEIDSMREHSGGFHGLSESLETFIGILHLASCRGFLCEYSDLCQDLIAGTSNELARRKVTPLTPLLTLYNGAATPICVSGLVIDCFMNTSYTSNGTPGFEVVAKEAQMS